MKPKPFEIIVEFTPQSTKTGIAYVMHPKEALIRCKDCKFSILNNGVYRGSETNGKCIAMGAVVNGDDYCSWAEKKEDPEA